MLNMNIKLNGKTIVPLAGLGPMLMAASLSPRFKAYIKEWDEIVDVYGIVYDGTGRLVEVLKPGITDTKSTVLKKKENFVYWIDGEDCALMQSIGFNDKQGNGIFQDHIIKCDPFQTIGEDQRIGLIQWNRTIGGSMIGFTIDGSPAPWDQENCEIIGTLHQDWELLKYNNGNPHRFINSLRQLK